MQEGASHKTQHGDCGSGQALDKQGRPLQAPFCKRRVVGMPVQVVVSGRALVPPGPWPSYSR